MQVRCECGKKYKVASRHLGKSFDCVRCGKKVRTASELDVDASQTPANSPANSPAESPWPDVDPFDQPLPQPMQTSIPGMASAAPSRKQAKWSLRGIAIAVGGTLLITGIVAAGIAYKVMPPNSTEVAHLNDAGKPLYRQHF